MTLKIKQPANRRLTVGDRVLAWFGKKRETVIPEEQINGAYRKFGDHPYMVVEAMWEGFWSALWR